MRAKRSYTDDDRAAVYFALQSNGGNLKRTAKDTGVPLSTVKTWAYKWRDHGLEPRLKTKVEQAATNFLTVAERVRDIALDRMEQLIPEAKKPGDLVNVVGMLDDKITRAKGLATQRTEVVHALPRPEEIRELMSTLITGAIDAGEQRDNEIIDAELIEIEERATI